MPGVTACQWQCEDRATQPLRAPSPAGGWAGTAGGVAGCSLSASPGPLCLRPCPIQLLPPLWAPGSGFAGLSLAALGVLAEKVQSSSSFHKSRTVLSKSSQDRDAFFSSDSAAREWEGPEPKALGTVTKGSGTRSHWAHRGKEGWWGVSQGACQGPRGLGRAAEPQVPQLFSAQPMSS